MPKSVKQSFLNKWGEKVKTITPQNRPQSSLTLKTMKKNLTLWFNAPFCLSQIQFLHLPVTQSRYGTNLWFVPTMVQKPNYPLDVLVNVPCCLSQIQFLNLAVAQSRCCTKPMVCPNHGSETKPWFVTYSNEMLLVVHLKANFLIAQWLNPDTA